MEIYLDTSAFDVILRLKSEDDGSTKEYRENFGRAMAEKLLGFLRQKLEENGKTFTDIKKITFFSGPGSFTGLRIGATIVNTLAHELEVPLFDHRGQKHDIIIPDYGRPANITPPRK